MNKHETPAPHERPIDHFERVLREAERQKAARFLQWNREQAARERGGR